MNFRRSLTIAAAFGFMGATAEAQHSHPGPVPMPAANNPLNQGAGFGYGYNNPINQGVGFGTGYNSPLSQGVGFGTGYNNPIGQGVGFGTGYNDPLQQGLGFGAGYNNPMNQANGFGAGYNGPLNQNGSPVRNGRPNQIAGAGVPIATPNPPAGGAGRNSSFNPVYGVGNGFNNPLFGAPYGYSGYNNSFNQGYGFGGGFSNPWNQFPMQGNNLNPLIPNDIDPTGMAGVSPRARRNAAVDATLNGLNPTAKRTAKGKGKSTKSGRRTTTRR